jgi:hypothetical protein
MFRLRSFCVARPWAFPPALALLVAFALLAPVALRAAGEKQLSRVKGTVGYQNGESAPFTAVVGRFLLPDESLAITRERSAAMLALPDSSLVALGENTRVQIGAFNDTAAGPGATVTVNGGTLRFDIRRPQGGAANYRFVTPSTQIAVRGTIGLLSFNNGITQVGCIVCAADSMVATVGAQSIPILTGTLLTITAAGAIITGTLTSAVLGGFSSAGVSTSSTSGPAGATAGVSSGAAGGVTGATATAVTAGALGAAAVGVTVSNQIRATAQPSGEPTGQPTGQPTAAPTQAGSISITKRTPPPVLGPPTAAPAPAAPGPQMTPRPGRR